MKMWVVVQLAEAWWTGRTARMADDYGFDHGEYMEQAIQNEGYCEDLQASTSGCSSLTELKDGSEDRNTTTKFGQWPPIMYSSAESKSVISCQFGSVFPRIQRPCVC